MQTNVLRRYQLTVRSILPLSGRKREKQGQRSETHKTKLLPNNRQCSANFTPEENRRLKEALELHNKVRKLRDDTCFGGEDANHKATQAMFKGFIDDCSYILGP